MPHIVENISMKATIFSSGFISIGGLHAKLWASKVAGILILGISKLPLGSPEIKYHLNAGLVARHIVYYKGEGGSLLQVRAVVSFVSSNLPVIHPCTKSALAMH